PDGVVARLGSARLRHGGWVWDVCFAPDGGRIASVGSDNAVRVWDGSTGKQRFEVRRRGGGFKRVAVAARGKVVVAAGARPGAAGPARTGRADLWRIAATTGAVAGKSALGIANPDPAVRFSADGSRLAVGDRGGKRLVVFDTATAASTWEAPLGKEAPGGVAF